MAAGEDIAADLGDGPCHAIFGAAFTRVDLKSQLAHFVSHRLAIERQAGALLVEVGDWRAIYRGVRPHRKLGIAMLAEDKGVDALGANLQFLRQQATQAGGIQPDAGAQHLAARQAGKLPYLPGDDVAGVGGHQKDAVKSVGHHRRHNALHNLRGGGQFIQPALAGAQRAAGDGDHRDIDIGAVAGLAGGDGHHPRQVGRGVAQVLSVGLSALLVKVDEDQLLANALVEQGVGRRRADIAGANNHHFTGFGVHIQISSTNGRG